MDKIRYAWMALALGLLLGACADMNMGDDETMEPAAGPTMSDQPDDTGMTESPRGDMMDSDDDEGSDTTQ